MSASLCKWLVTLCHTWAGFLQYGYACVTCGRVVASVSGEIAILGKIDWLDGVLRLFSSKDYILCQRFVHILHTWKGFCRMGYACVLCHSIHTRTDFIPHALGGRAVAFEERATYMYFTHERLKVFLPYGYTCVWSESYCLWKDLSNTSHMNGFLMYG